MQTRFFHGDISPGILSRALMAHFNRGNLVSQMVGDDQHMVVQIATRRRPASGGQTAISVILDQLEDGVAVKIGKQAWMGIAASLGVTALSAWRNPFSLLGRLDDIAQDIENFQLSDQVWSVIENVAQLHGASFKLSERLRRTVCEYCRTGNPVGSPHCIACGAPMGGLQPNTCPSCGFVLKRDERVCPNCGENIGG